MKKFDVTALGELLIDFTKSETSQQENPLLEANPGGAPCNVLAMLNRLGKRTAFIGKVGDDSFGHMLKSVARESDADVTKICLWTKVSTQLLRLCIHTLTVNVSSVSTATPVRT